MLKQFLGVLMLCFIFGKTVSAQTSYEAEILQFQNDLNAEYKNTQVWDQYKACSHYGEEI